VPRTGIPQHRTSFVSVALRGVRDVNLVSPEKLAVTSAAPKPDYSHVSVSTTAHLQAVSDAMNRAASLAASSQLC